MPLSPWDRDAYQRALQVWGPFLVLTALLVWALNR
jgi:hypothetical protein